MIKKTKVEEKASEVKKAVEAKGAEIKKEAVAAAKKIVETKGAELKKETVVTAKKVVEQTKKAVKKDIKIAVTVEYHGKQVQEKEIVTAVKKAWTKSGKKVGDIKTIDLYIKPEDDAVYYVVNGFDSGKIEL